MKPTFPDIISQILTIIMPENNPRGVHLDPIIILHHQEQCFCLTVFQVSYRTVTVLLS